MAMCRHVGSRQRNHLPKRLAISRNYGQRAVNQNVREFGLESFGSANDTRAYNLLVSKRCPKVPAT